MNLPRSTFYKKTHEQILRLREESRTTLRAAIEGIVEEWPAYGYRRVTQELRRRGTVVNHKRVARCH